MSAATTVLRAAALALVITSGVRLHAAEPKLPVDGWVSWDIPAVEGARSWCCFDGREGDHGGPAACTLDDRSNSLGSRGDDETITTARVYARSTGGKMDRLQVLSPSCPVVTKTPVQALADVTADESARWLAAKVRQGDLDSDRREHLMPALAMHRGDVARDALLEFARSNPRVETRKSAVFWLAETGAAEAERAIGEAVRKDPDGDVREEAIFALSLLPDERATRALIAAAEDQSLSREQRKRAVFWLSQSRSDSAAAYLDRVLTKVSLP